MTRLRPPVSDPEVLQLEVAKTIPQVRELVKAARQTGATIGFVPTMGALHEGHGSLIRRSVAENGYTVVSIFVNPLQFGPGEDYDRYPRTLDHDLDFCRSLGVDLVFCPGVAEMYPQPSRTFVDIEQLGDHLCGASRPGHFRGVATVVTKLFNIVQPDVAYFGQKDAQQAAIIKRMVADLNIPVTIKTCPTVREADGLAVSSRNTYLTPPERQAATVLYRALQAAYEAAEAGEVRADKLRQVMLDVLATEPLARVDYAEIVDADTMQPLERLDSPALAALAVYIGDTRLIDNIILPNKGDNTQQVTGEESG